jgi:ubiquinone/menaquinone biosynthesis C-methylase UbiE
MHESSFLNPEKVVEAAGIHAGLKVADFGSGAGFFTRAAARYVGPGGVVCAVDIHQDLLPRLKNLALGEGLRNIEVMHGDVEQVGGSHLPDKTFDFVLVTNLLFAIECKDCLVQEVARVLKPHGKVLVVDWKDSFGGLGPHPDHVVTEPAGRNIFEQSGFTFVSNIPAGEYHWGCILKK